MSASRVVTGVDCTGRPSLCTPIGRRARAVARPRAGCCVIAVPRVLVSAWFGKSLQSLAQDSHGPLNGFNTGLRGVEERSQAGNSRTALQFFAARPFAQ